MIKKGTYTIDDTTFFKGIAIFMIFTHNYFHRFAQFGIENEHAFHIKRTQLFIEHMASLDAANIFGAVFGFLGHYAVQVFVFFSAYGLAIQYKNRGLKYMDFVLPKLKKIYFLLAFGLVVAVITYLLSGYSFSYKKIIHSLFLLPTTISSFSSKFMYSSLAGPFWFFPLIIQVYVLFPLLYQWVGRYKNNNVWFPMIISYLIIFPLYALMPLTAFSYKGEDMGTLTIWGNVIGHLPEVILGVILAQNKWKSFSISTVLICIVLFALSQTYSFFFPFSFVLSLIILLSIGNFIKDRMPNFLLRIIYFLGKISMIVFVLNGPLRTFEIFSIEKGLAYSFYMFPLFTLILIGASFILYKLFNFLIVKFKI